MKKTFYKVSEEEMSVEFNEIKKMMNLLSDLFSIRTSFIYASGGDYTREIPCHNGAYQKYCEIIQQEMKHLCITCDNEKYTESLNRNSPLLYRCYSGLYEMVSPVIVEDHLAGYLHFGQVRAEEDFGIVAAECSLHKHSKIKNLEKAYYSMNMISKDKLMLIAELFRNISEIIIKNKLIRLRSKNPEFHMKKYVEENLANPITIKSTAEYVNRSTSYVTHKFKELYGKTFHDYVNQARIEYSKKLLNEKPISEIYQLCGFTNRYHFSKVFKSFEKVTPNEYQRNIAKKKRANGI